MAAPTYNWNTINASQCDADSPIDVTLMEAIRQDLVHLKEVLYDTYTPIKGHNHDGANSALLGTSVTKNMLKFTEGSYAYNGNGPIDTYVTLSRYTHAWYASVSNADNAGAAYGVSGPYTDLTSTGTKEPHLHIVMGSDAGGITATVYWPYHDN